MQDGALTGAADPLLGATALAWAVRSGGNELL